MKAVLSYVLWLSVCTGFTYGKPSAPQPEVHDCPAPVGSSSSISLELSETQKTIRFRCPSTNGTPPSLAPEAAELAYTVTGDMCSENDTVRLSEPLPTARRRTIKRGGDKPGGDRVEQLSIETLPTDADKRICFRCSDNAGHACSVFVTARRSAPKPPNTCSPGRPVWLHAEANDVLTFHCGSQYDNLDPVTVEENGKDYIFTNRFCDTPNRLDRVLPGATISEVPEPTPPYSDVWKSFQLSLKELPSENQQMLCYKCVSKERGGSCRVVITVSPTGAPAEPPTGRSPPAPTPSRPISGATILNTTCAVMFPLALTAVSLVAD